PAYVQKLGIVEMVIGIPHRTPAFHRPRLTPATPHATWYLTDEDTELTVPLRIDASLADDGCGKPEHLHICRTPGRCPGCPRLAARRHRRRAYPRLCWRQSVRRALGRPPSTKSHELDLCGASSVVSSCHPERGACHITNVAVRGVSATVS